MVDLTPELNQDCLMSIKYPQACYRSELQYVFSDYISISFMRVYYTLKIKMILNNQNKGD